MTQPDAIVFRDIEQLSEMHEVERLQKTVWGVDDLDVLPSLAMRPLVEVGGILIGAFDNDRMVGFVFGFPGRHDGEDIIHSDMLAVLSEYRSFGLGFRLKLAQRERALAMGIKTISWTFDPLRALNASLNFARLGVFSDRYEIDYYGETSSVLHRLGTDRLWVTWLLNSERTIERIQTKTHSVSSEADGTRLVRIGDAQEPVSQDCLEGPQVLIEIPTALDELLEQQPGLATDWRMATREAFTRALKAGYIVEDFVIDKGAGKGSYVLKLSINYRTGAERPRSIDDSVNRI
jgi:predicted GNAT superfamily acetyltransferase